ncbi:hypothetical protein GA0061101_106144 [Rhizobium lusitanum]|uniref:Uncharacterized protein n=1 Tax=Rhizobium lusitanum TaxID=293958 RepID=A0A1C3VT27_9HYPH|nr:hypothetical protein GA0061101_106144 [Rhizobium lusitanum]
MRTEFRTAKQIDADKLDLQVYNLICALDSFAEKYGDDRVRDMSSQIYGMRHRVRRHMHSKDLEASS